MLTKNELLSGLGKFKRGLEDELTMPAYTAGYGLSLADKEFSVTLQGGNTTTFDDGVVDNINEMFRPNNPALRDRYARAPFDSANVVGLDLSHLIDGVNFELDTENLTDGQVTRIRSGSASYNVDNGISRGYIEVKTICGCILTVKYSISSQSGDYGGCIITEDAPNTEFTWADLKSSTVNKFFWASSISTNKTSTYRFEANKTYYLNFGYAKNSSTNSNDDRFYIHSISVVPETYGNSKIDYFFHCASDAINTIVAGAGGAFCPSVSSMDEILFSSATLPFMENRINKFLACPDYRCKEYRSVSFGANKVSLANGTSTPYSHSLISYSGNSSVGAVTLTADTSSITYDYKIVKLTESGGFITRQQNYTAGYKGQFYVQPFVVTASGAPSLGTATSIMSAQSATYPNSYIAMTHSIFDPTNVMFYVAQQTANGYDHKYTTIAFQGIGTGLTRVKALTTLGTAYNVIEGHTHFNRFTPRLRNSGVFFDRKTKVASADNDVGATTPFTTYCPYISYSLQTFSSSGSVTSNKGYAVVNHGLYRSAPTVFEFNTTGGSLMEDCPVWYRAYKPRIWRSISCPGACYAICFGVNVSKGSYLNNDWFLNNFVYYKVDFLRATCERLSGDMTAVINDLVLDY